MVAELAEIRDRLDTVLVAIGGQSFRREVLDVDGPEETEAVFGVDHGAAGVGPMVSAIECRMNPRIPNWADFLGWVETVERLHDRIDKAL